MSAPSAPQPAKRLCRICGQDGDYLPHGDARDCERSMRKLSHSHCADPAAHHVYEPIGPKHA